LQTAALPLGYPAGISVQSYFSLLTALVGQFPLQLLPIFENYVDSRAFQGDNRTSPGQRKQESPVLSERMESQREAKAALFSTCVSRLGIFDT
jgi:hypothetical protein